MKYFPEQTISITMITRRTMNPSIQDLEKMKKEQNSVKLISNLCVHDMTIEILDEKANAEKRRTTKHYKYFSGYKNYIAEVKELGPEKVAKSFFEFFRAFSDSSPLIKLEEIVKSIVLIHYKNSKGANALQAVLENSKTGAQVSNQKINLTTFDQDSLTLKNSRRETTNSGFFSEIFYLIGNQEGDESVHHDQDGPEFCDDKLFLMYIDLQRIPVMSHLCKKNSKF